MTFGFCGFREEKVVSHISTDFCQIYGTNRRDTVLPCVHHTYLKSNETHSGPSTTTFDVCYSG